MFLKLRPKDLHIHKDSYNNSSKVTTDLVRFFMNKSLIAHKGLKIFFDLKGQKSYATVNLVNFSCSS